MPIVTFPNHTDTKRRKRPWIRSKRGKKIEKERDSGREGKKESER